VNIRNIRMEKGMTQQELADLVGLDRTTITKIESGATPSIDTAKKIASVLGFNWTRFFEDEDELTKTGTE
jgi:putative transcriptional regulator